MSHITWLHLSDFHFRTEDSLKRNVEDFNRDVVLKSLLDDLGDYPQKHNLKIDFIIITGDLAFSGQEAEYKIAGKFLDNLLEVFQLPKSRLFIVPGNHDIDRKKISSFLNIPLDNRDKVNGFLVDKVVKPLYFSKFEGYRDFMNHYFKEYLKFDYENNYFWTKNITIAKKGIKIGFLGLNSSWNSSGDKDRYQLLIGEKQVVDALAKVEKSDLVLAAFHHPFTWLKEDEEYNDLRIVKKELGGTCQFVLHGHMHEPSCLVETSPDYRIGIIAAGSCYDKRPYSNSYNYLTYNLETQNGSLHIRRYSDRAKRWLPDNEIYTSHEDGIYPIDLSPPSSSECNDRICMDLIVPDEYKTWVLKRCLEMELSKLKDDRDHDIILKIEMPEIFIPLFAHDPQEKKPEHLEQTSYNIEKLAGTHDYLVIKGQAGTGKTTLLKHLAYSVIKRNNQFGLNGYLPVIVFLNNVQKQVKELPEPVIGAPLAERILEASFDEYGNGLSLNLVKAFCNVNKTVFLLDGLDEIDGETRKIIVGSLSDFQDKYACKLIYSGRPSGMDVFTNHSAKVVEINRLNFEQIKEFVGKWFQYDKQLHTRGKTVHQMLGEIQTHPKVKDLTETPLMLTAICLLYHYERRLPDQRAELYERFVSNLISKRFKENMSKVLGFLMKLAFEVHTQPGKQKTFDRVFAIRILKDFYPEHTESKFDQIEQRCGLLKCEDHQFMFWHMTFQEFFTARYIHSRFTDYDEEIEDYWNNDWFDEVIKLLIGYFYCKDSKGWAHKIVMKGLEPGDQSPYFRWRLATDAFTDIPETDRDGKIVEQARKRLVEILKKEKEPAILAKAGESLGWLNDLRNLREFIPINGGNYDLDELGQKEVKDFELGKYPVSNRWYRDFIDAKGYETAEYWTPEGRKWLQASLAEYPRLWFDRNWTCPNAPVVGVCWYEAAAFCSWLTKTINDGYYYWLPNEWEWQAAAAGQEKREYPWNGGWQENLCNWKGVKTDKTSTVGIFLAGSTLEGIFDLSGNVWEWTTSNYHTKQVLTDFAFDSELHRLYEEAYRLWEKGKDLSEEEKYQEYTKNRGGSQRQLPGLRGGSWRDNEQDARCANRNYIHPDYRNSFVGFRCTRTRIQ